MYKLTCYKFSDQIDLRFGGSCGLVLNWMIEVKLGSRTGDNVDPATGPATGPATNPATNPSTDPTNTPQQPTQPRR